MVVLYLPHLVLDLLLPDLQVPNDPLLASEKTLELSGKFTKL